MVVVVLLPVPAMVPPVARMVMLARCGAAASVWAWTAALDSSSATSAVIHRAGVVCSMCTPLFAVRWRWYQILKAAGRPWRKNHRARCYYLVGGATSSAPPRPESEIAHDTSRQQCRTNRHQGPHAPAVPDAGRGAVRADEPLRRAAPAQGRRSVVHAGAAAYLDVRHHLRFGAAGAQFGARLLRAGHARAGPLHRRDGHVGRPRGGGLGPRRDRLRSAGNLRGGLAHAGHRRGGAERDHHARLYPAPRGLYPGPERRRDPDRLPAFGRHAAPARLPEP